MVDQRYIANIVQEVLKQLSSQIYMHHGIQRSHKNRINTLQQTPEVCVVETELSIHKQLCDALAKDRQAFYTFAQELAIDVLS